MAIEVLPPDINESFKGFSVVPEKNKIRFGLTAIKNVGENVVDLIIDERKAGGPFKDIHDFFERADIKVLNKKSLESLAKAGAFDTLEDRTKVIGNLEKLLEWKKVSQKIKESGQKGLFDMFGGGEMSATPKIVLGNVEPLDDRLRLDWEKELLGLYISGHPLQNMKDYIENNAMTIRKVSNDLLGIRTTSVYKGNQRHIYRGEEATIIGIITEIKKIITKKGDSMLFIKVEDLTEKIEVVIFPSMLERNPEVFVDGKIISVTGKADVRDEVAKIVANSVEEVLVDYEES